MSLQDAYRMVYNDILNKGCGLFVGHYDARNGKPHFMYGISMVMEYIAYNVSEADGEAFEQMFMDNMTKCLEEARGKR